MLAQQPQVGLDPGDVLHRQHVLGVTTHHGQVQRIHPLVVLSSNRLLVQVTQRVGRGELGRQAVLAVEFQEGVKIQVGRPQRPDEPGLFGLQRCDPFGVVSPWQGQRLVDPPQDSPVPGGNLGQGPDHAQPQPIPLWLGVARTVDVLVESRIDVSAAALHEQRHGPVAQRVLDHLRRETGDVGRVATGRGSHDRVHRKIVDHRQRTTVCPIESQDADFRVNRPRAHHLGIRRQRVGSPHVQFTAVLELQSPVLLHTILVSGPHANPDRHQFRRRLLDRLGRPIEHIGTRHTVTVTAVDDQRTGVEPDFLLQLRPQLVQKIVLDVANLGDGHEVQ